MKWYFNVYQRLRVHIQLKLISQVNELLQKTCEESQNGFFSN